MKAMNLKFYEGTTVNFKDYKSYANAVLYCDNNGVVHEVLVCDNQGRMVFDRKNDYVNVAICYCSNITHYSGDNGEPIRYSAWIDLLEELFYFASLPQDCNEDLLELCKCYNETWPARVEYVKAY